MTMIAQEMRVRERVIVRGLYLSPHGNTSSCSPRSATGSCGRGSSRRRPAFREQREDRAKERQERLEQREDSTTGKGG